MIMNHEGHGSMSDITVVVAPSVGLCHNIYTVLRRIATTLPKHNQKLYDAFCRGSHSGYLEDHVPMYDYISSQE